MSDLIMIAAAYDINLSRRSEHEVERHRADLMQELVWKIESLQAENERLREALERVDRCATYPVCTTINPRGYEVRPPNKELVEMIAGIVRAALAKETGE